MLKAWESFFTRRLYHRIQDCWGRPIASSPGARIQVMERTSTNENCTLHLTGRRIECLNLGSYNYLGFADDWAISCKREVLSSLDEWPVSMSSSRAEAGSITLHEELEQTVARFLGKEAAVVYTMVSPCDYRSCFDLAGLQHQHLDSPSSGGAWVLDHLGCSQSHLHRQWSESLWSQYSCIQVSVTMLSMLR